MSLESIFGQSDEVPNQKTEQIFQKMLIVIILLILLLTFLFGLLSYQWHSSEHPSPAAESTFTMQPPQIVLNTAHNAQTPPLIIPAPSKPAHPSTKSLSPPHQKLYQDLKTEFQMDLTDWQAEIEPATLTIRFLNPEILFEIGEVGINEHYQSVLADFFPRYLTILKKYQTDIKALRIEGHTSTEWRGTDSENEAYLHNMILSQKRTFAVLEYCFWLPAIKADRQWLRQILITNGLSSSQPIFKKGLQEIQLSRRVEFSLSL